MIKVTLPNYNAVVERVKARIADKVKEKTERVANNVWVGVIGGNQGVDYPYWSGGYAASWIFNEGTAPHEYVESVRERPGLHPVPTVTLQHVYKPFTLVTISNANPYARNIEHVGSPSHLTPWKVAFNAYSHAVKFV